jgi:hypothetical protein
VTPVLPALPPDPLAFKDLLWPGVYFYSRQREAIYSFVENDVTTVPAGNMLGKDFVAGFLVLYFFMTRRPCRIVTTSAKDDHLRVLWGEIGNFVQTAAYPLLQKDGGPLILNHQDMRWVLPDGTRCPKSYAIGMVAGPDSMAAMQGHHVAATGDGVPRTAFFCDEASSVDDEYWRMARTWCNRAFIFGNPWPCDNFFHRHVEEDGDVPRPRGEGYLQKVIQISAYDSPNVRYALAEVAAGRPVTDRILVPGVKSYAQLEKDLAAWKSDPVQQTVSLHGKFYKGGEVMLFPQGWLAAAQDLADALKGTARRGVSIGVDPGEGGDPTAWVVGDELGVLEVQARPTPNTADVNKETIRLADKWGVPPEQWFYDAGGGGQEHTDYLRDNGYPDVPAAVSFGGAPTVELKRSRTMFDEKVEVAEKRAAYLNMRAELYATFSARLDPDLNPAGYAIPRRYKELVRQLSKMPRLYDKEGKLRMLSKNRLPNNKTKEKTLRELLGRSPDEADAAALCCWGTFAKTHVAEAGVF